MFFDKLKKNLEKREILTELNEPTNWVSTGSAVLNYRMTGRIDVGISNKRSLLLWGQSGTGKSFLSSTIAKNCQDDGYRIIYLDSEESISKDYMKKIGINLSEDWFVPIKIDTIEQATAAVSEVFNAMTPEKIDKKTGEILENGDKFVIVIDSLAGLMSEKEADEFSKGTAKGDQGQLAKRLKLFVKNINKKIADYDAFCVMVTHAYQSQDMYSPEKWICTGGKGMQFFPSFSVMLDKARIKGDEKGFRMKFEVSKTRFTAPFQKGELVVPYESGIEFTDGLLEVLEEEGVVKKNGGWYSFDKNGENVKFQAGKLNEHVDNLMEIFANKELVESDD